LQIELNGYICSGQDRQAGMEDVWKELVLLFGTNGITGTFSWFFARRKANAETDSTIIDNLQQSLSFYKDICDDNQRRLDENQKRLDEMQQRLQERQQQLNDALQQVNELQQEIVRLRKEENKKYLELQKELIETRRRLLDKP